MAAVVDRVAHALEDWTHLLGREAVVVGADLAPYLADVTASEREVYAALRIRSRDQVPAVVRIAREHGVPLYPISTGCGWGLGSRLPVRDGAVIVDLGGMTRILGIDRATSTVVVEPGVTQGQLAEYLGNEAPELVANMTLSAAFASLVGNTLDRGIGYLAPRVEDVRGLEIVLGTGVTLRIGEWHGAGAHHGPHWRHGIGPSLQGLFIQSNFGIVTAAALRLRRRPAATAAFRVSVPHDQDAVELLDALARLHIEGVLSAPTRILDGTWTDGSPERCGPAWTAFGGVSGRASVVEALRDEVYQALGPLGEIDLISVGRQSVMVPVESWWWSALSVMGGRPTDLPVGNWAARVGVTCEADELGSSNFGMLCDVRAIPFTGRAGLDASRLAREVCEAYSHRPCISMTALDEHTLEASFVLLFDRSSASRTAVARACQDELTKALTAADLVPRRASIDQMLSLVSPEDAYWQTVAALKRSLDPGLIISPGRYNAL